MRLRGMRKNKGIFFLWLLLSSLSIAKAQDKSLPTTIKALGVEYSMVYSPHLFVANLAGIGFQYKNVLLGTGYCLALNINPSEKDQENYSSYSNYQGVYLNIGYLFRNSHLMRLAPYLLNQYTEGNGIIESSSDSKWGTSASYTAKDVNRIDLYAGMKLDFRVSKRFSANVGVFIKYCSIVKTTNEYTWHAPSVLSDPDSGAGSTVTTETEWLDYKNFYDAISPSVGLRYYFFVK